MLNSLHLIDQEALCQYLLSETQHKIGGFGKFPGAPPGTSVYRLGWVVSCPALSVLMIADIMHSCLGLAGLACMRHADLKPFDPSLCISFEARDRIENLPFRYIEHPHRSG